MVKRTWLITGINRGLGRDLAEALLERGDRVAGTARRLDELDGLKATYGERLWTAALDLTDTGAIQSVVDRAFAALGRIDVVVNNAGFSLVGAVEECTEEMIRHILDTNLLGSILMVKAALPHLRAQGGGRILQVASSLGQLAVPGLSLYVASKWGIEGFIESTAQEVAPFGIEATLFEPGQIRTDFGAKAALAPTITAYDGTPARGIRSHAESSRNAKEKSAASPGDPTKMAKVIIDSVDQSPAPKRVVMGSDAYNDLSAAYRERSASLETQKALAFSTDF
ncbi:SDR family oxidoreductase [Nostoc sp.]|uniref:SDR family oxidoreductase n=1 Tax=Nostoc sp. TaxID=1180 RepID=UPI002FFC0D87